MILRGKKIVAVASSTGGPRALQEFIPLLPSNLNAPVVLVQHMPAGFTKALSERLNQISSINVTEAVEGETIEKGHVYIAAGGKHMNVFNNGINHVIRYSDEPYREGVKPCANYMYESLIDSNFDEVVCVVLTGMGADGTVGIKALSEKKKTTIVVQNEETCTVFGMPKAVLREGLTTKSMDLQAIAKEIIQNVGVF